MARSGITRHDTTLGNQPVHRQILLRQLTDVIPHPNLKRRNKEQEGKKKEIA